MINSYIFERNQRTAMHTRILGISLLFFFISYVSFSQYTEMINTNRPGVSQGAFSVGTNVLQFETGLRYGTEEHRLLDTKATIFGWDYAVRYGFWREELEVSIIGDFQRNVVDDLRTTADDDDKNTFANFRSNTIGAKYLIYDPYRQMEAEGPNLYSWKANNRFQWADLIPAISVYAGLNVDIIVENPYTPESTGTLSPKFVLSTQNNWIGGFVFVTNIVVDRITTDFPSYGYIVTLTHATNDYFSIFLENQGFKSDFYADQLLRGGVAALINENLHVDLSATINFKDTPSVFYGRVGVAYRFDMHDRDEYIEEKGKAGREKRKKYREQKKEKNQRKDGFEDDGGGLLEE
ncbi:transporter [Luteirhabdus pelagi]|uniref:transporter n=1 Tax=Luteirhabdus pelagi TaxID=2792783 RepID=UPI001F45D035|nr:transporter [Luteirhabdus pelagi]